MNKDKHQARLTLIFPAYNLKLRTGGVAFSAEILHTSKKLNLSIYEKSIV